jgi:hypothetical protein
MEMALSPFSQAVVAIREEKVSSSSEPDSAEPQLSSKLSREPYTRMLLLPTIGVRKNMVTNEVASFHSSTPQNLWQVCSNGVVVAMERFG